ncbi:MAG TPA: hypothetical protein VFB63_33330, partial [Bryobacteraceae bacterium]|nr:hypothetical protein [Bryobacteraceae bacterium]
SDGQWLALTSASNETRHDIWISGAVQNATPVHWLKTEFDEALPRFSPNGQWLAYVSDETGRTEVYIRPFRGETHAAEGKIRVSIGGGDYPVWSRSGNELFFMTADGSIHAASTQNLGSRQTVTPPVKLFRPCSETGLRANPLVHQPYMWIYDVSPDGRFLFNCMSQPAGRFVVWMNWRLADSEVPR